MSIYAKNLTEAQRGALEQYERITAHEPLGQAQLDAGEITFAQLCDINATFMQGMAYEAKRALQELPFEN